MLSHCDQLPPTRSYSTRSLLLWSGNTVSSSLLPSSVSENSFWLVRNTWFCLNRWHLSSYLLILIPPALILCFNMPETYEVNHSSRRFPLSLFQSRVSSSDSLSLAQVFSPGFYIPLNPSLPGCFLFPFFLWWHMRLHTVKSSIQWCCASGSFWRLHWLFQLLLLALFYHITSLLLLLFSRVLNGSRAVTWKLGLSVFTGK